MSLPQLIATGRLLADRLIRRGLVGALVMGVPSRGVVVGYRVALRLGSPLDVVLARRVMVGQDGHAVTVGAVALPDIYLVEAAAACPAAAEEIDDACTTAMDALEARLPILRGDAPLPDLADRTIILVDDAAVTGLTLEAAIAALRAHHPASIVVAVGSCSDEALSRLRDAADDVVTLEMEPYAWLEGVHSAETLEAVTIEDAELYELIRGAQTRAAADLYGGLETDGIASSDDHVA